MDHDEYLGWVTMARDEGYDVPCGAPVIKLTDCVLVQCQHKGGILGWAWIHATKEGQHATAQ